MNNRTINPTTMDERVTEAAERMCALQTLIVESRKQHQRIQMLADDLYLFMVHTARAAASEAAVGPLAHMLQEPQR
ncbi:hypothetical protein ACF8MH_03620 [Pseudomonas sp. YQ_13]|uniref:hypothetical protein n=1 Tax=Pseudomonas sp. YQ_13 TaxID=3367235 RepID=UPI00370A405D